MKLLRKIIWFDWCFLSLARPCSSSSARNSTWKISSSKSWKEVIMASNVALHPTGNHRWFSGFGNIFSKENHQWGGTRKWLIQVAVWLVLINGMVLFISVILPHLSKTNQALQTVSASEAAEIKATFANQGLAYFFIMSGMVAGAGVAIFAQDALIGEKRTGTAAWVLSKPVSRTAFLLAKLADAWVGLLVTL